MRKLLSTFIVIVSFILISKSVIAQDFIFKKENTVTVGRGIVKWKENSVSISDCFISLKDKNPDRFEMSFSAKTPIEKDHVQIWSGFGFQDRDNRYGLGLRGGNNNDLYLCRYQSNAKNKMLALESLDFNPVPGEWYKIKIIFWEGNIRVYLNDEKNPRIVTLDEDYLKGGSAILGGGWIQTEFTNLVVKELSNDDIAIYAANTLKHSNKLSPELIRKLKRSEFQQIKITKINQSRTEILLNGNWLFMPDHKLKFGTLPYSTNLDDNNWHVMNVPDFWNPVRNWLHLQDSGFPHKGSGISDNYREKEEARCDAYTFDYQKTSAAWYRQWIEFPNNLGRKKISLHFDAVSKLADVYVNGNYVGGHVGMFGDFEFDITDYVNPGNNIITVGVKVRKDKKAINADQNVARAVSVDITNDMLNSLPNGMFRGDEGGIWQDVTLIITEPTYIEDVYANVRSDGGAFEIKLKNDSDEKENVEVKIEVIDKQNNKTLYISEKGEHTIIESGETKQVICETGKIKPKLWSPEHPNMYTLITRVYKKDKLIDSTNTNIGFRTFEVIGNQFHLNGKPYWLRGANHPPTGIAPNDTALANKFFKLMHDGNQMITRSHGCPFTKAWMDAADKQGVGISYEGSWPWLMISNIPSQELLDIWKDEMISLVRKYRNHPSLLIWTINNEMYFTMFYHNDPPDIRIKKWKVLSEVIKEIRKLSPNTAISGDSGYSRVKEDYEQNLKPHKIDDGDIDDRHVYFNWYNRDFYQVINGEWAERIYWSPGANLDRPFFSQETSTGYTNNDDGHYNRKYLFNNYVPQAWVGDWAYEDKDPQFSLTRHAFLSKELYEVIRRTSPETAGTLLFANVTWFQNVFNSEKIAPYPIYKSFNTAAQPVLISAELFGRNFFAGTTITPRVCIVNNAIDGKSLPPSTLEWKIVCQDITLDSGIQSTDAVPYYDRLWLDTQINLPKNLPDSKSNCQLILTLKSGNDVITENNYDILLAEKNWVNANTIPANKNISVYDITGETFKILDFLGVKYHKLNNLTEIRFSKIDLLIVANLDSDEEIPYNWEDVGRICGNGMNVLLIHPGKHLQWLFYERIASVYERKGRIVNMHISEHSAFDEIDPMELSWWQQNGREIPRACRRSFRLKKSEGISSLATYIRPHTGLGSSRAEYLAEMSGIPLMEITEKQGRLIASEMEINMGNKDPIAAKLFLNLINDLLK